MSVSFDFTGKVILITGSSSGIGAATAVLFAKSGAQVVITGTKADKLSKVAQQCQQVSPEGLVALQVVADVINEEDLKRLVDNTIKEFGQLNVLVNNAGAGLTNAIDEQVYIENVKKLLDTNLLSALRLTQLCVPYLEKSKGNVVNISSVSAFLPVSL